MNIYQTDDFAKFQESSISNLESTIKNPPAAPTADKPAAAQPTAAAPATKLAVADLEALKKEIPVKGNKDAEIIIIEYSDAECPFCQRHTDAGTLKTVSEKFGDDVAISFRHYPLSFHPKAKPAAEAMECARVAGGDEAFFAVEEGVFASKDLSTEGLKAVAEKAGVDMNKRQTCMDNGDTSSAVDAQMAEGQSKFGVRGTPGNVVLNTKTGEWKLVSGAQGVAAFEAAVNELKQ